jgi:hypothetical protein
MSPRCAFIMYTLSCIYHVYFVILFSFLSAVATFIVLMLSHFNVYML